MRYLNLLQIRLPLPGVVSILHRVSGVLLVVALPFSLAALQCSVDSVEGYEAVAEWLALPLVKLAVVATGWALFHHLCAGARFLLIDVHVGVSLQAARWSSVAVVAVSLLMTLAFAVAVW